MIIGPLPPPMGGVSVYVQRLSRQLRAEGHAVENVDLSRGNPLWKIMILLRIILDPRAMNLELHSFDFSAMTAGLLRPFAKSISYMDHNTLIYGRNIGRLRSAILKRFFRRADRISFVSAEGRRHYESQGFTFRNAVIRNAFLPPATEDSARIISGYSAETREFLKSHEPILVANASQIVFVQGTDLYGLDLCTELVLSLREEFPKIGLVFALANATSQPEYFESIRERIRRDGGESNIHFLTDHQEVWPIFQRAAVMLRPTTGDGFSVSVAEALALGCPVVASDAVERPEGVTLFRNRDFDDFKRKVLAVLHVSRAA